MRWRIYDTFLIGENRWRAQRFGAAEGMIDFGSHEIKSMDTLLSEMFELIEEDAGILHCTEEVFRAPDLLARGTSSDRQRRAYAEAREGGKEHQDALCDVVKHLMDEFTVDL